MTVSGITIKDNTITNKYVSTTSVYAFTFARSDPIFLLCSDQALRIKTKSSATDATVSNITYSGNTGTGMRKFGVLIDQVCYIAHSPSSYMLLILNIWSELPLHIGHPGYRCLAFGQ